MQLVRNCSQDERRGGLHFGLNPAKVIAPGRKYYRYIGPHFRFSKMAGKLQGIRDNMRRGNKGKAVPRLSQTFSVYGNGKGLIHSRRLDNRCLFSMDSEKQ